MSKCDQCQTLIDPYEEGGFIYPDGSFICPSCEGVGDGQLCGDHLLDTRKCGCKL